MCICCGLQSVFVGGGGEVRSVYEPSGPSGRRLTPVSVA